MVACLRARVAAVLLLRGGPGWFWPAWALLGPRRACLASAFAGAVGCAVWPLFGPLRGPPAAGPVAWGRVPGPAGWPPSLSLCLGVATVSLAGGLSFSLSCGGFSFSLTSDDFQLQGRLASGFPLLSLFSAVVILFLQVLLEFGIKEG